MKDKDKTHGQLLKELVQLRRRIAQLEGCERQRKAVEETLTRSDQEKTVVLGSISELVAYQDTRMRILWVNRAAAESVGADPQQLVGRHCYEIWPQRDRPCVGCPVVKARKSGRPQEAEITTPDGRIWSIRGYPVQDTKGTVTGAVEVTLEITERKRAEESLRTERDKAQQYLDIAEVILVALNKKGEITLINRKGNQLLGYKKGELLGKNWFTTCVPSRVRKKIKNGFQQLMAGEVTLSEFYENPVLTKSGTERIMAWHNALLEDTQGNPIGTLSSGEDITEHKRAEEALKESESRFRNIVENSKDGIIFFDGKTRKILFGNHAMAELLGCTEGDLIGRSIPSLHPSEEWPSVERKFQKHVRGEISLSTEIPIQRDDGSVFYADISSSSITLDGGTYFSAFFRDITERKWMEEKYQTIVKTSLDSFGLHDLEGRFLEVNDSCCKITGYTREELLTMSISDIEAAENPEMIAQHIKTIMKQGYDRFETRHKRKDGQIIDVEVSVNYLDVEEGRLVIFVHDITERKQAEEALRESETRFRTLFEAIPDTVLVHDDKGTILHINEIGAQQLEWSAKDLIGRNLREIVTPENAASIADHVRETHKVGWNRFETTYVSRSGWRTMAEVYEHPIGFGTKKAILSVARDITDRKQTEEALLNEKIFSDAIMDSSPGLLFVFDDKGNVLRWNRNSEKFTEYSTQEISKMNVLDFVVQEDKKSATEAIQEVFNKGQASAEITILSKSGKKIPFYFTGLHTHIENITCVVCSGFDITDIKEAEEALQRSYDQLQKTFISAINALASTVEMKDQYTAGHQPRVTQLACAIAEEMGLSKDQIEGIRMAGLIHDIGKIVVPAEILNKPGPLTEVQYEMIKMHPQAGHDILKRIAFPWPVAQIVQQHHEMMDGSGYPQGLAGEDILLEARVMAVANVVEAMIAHRPYRPAYDIEEALAEILNNRGIKYDPTVVDACLRLFTERGFVFDSVQ